MRMRTGRLATGHFMEVGEHLPSRCLKWHNQILRSTGVLTDATWFSVDNAAGQASMVNHNDVDGNALWQLGGYLEDDEAVLVVTEHAFGEYWGARQWHPTEADGPLFRRPPGVIVGGDMTNCTLQIPLADAIGMAAFLVVAKRIYVLRDGYGIGIDRLEVVPSDAVSALFADT